jgi:hypothetical protein
VIKADVRSGVTDAMHTKVASVEQRLSGKVGDGG